MRTAGLPSLLLLLSLLLIGTESNETSTVPGPGGQSTPTTTPKLESQSNNSKTTDTGGGKPETKPTDAATVVTSAQGSTLGKEPVTTPSTNETGQIEGNDVLAGQTGNRTNSTDLSDTRINTTEKDGKRKETGPTMAGPESSKAPETIVATSGPPAPKAAGSPVNTGEDQSKESKGSDKHKGPTTKPPKGEDQSKESKGSDKHKGPITEPPKVEVQSKETKESDKQKAPTTEPPKDKKMLWILLPVLGVLVAGVIFVLKKYTKGHGGTDTAENGTENASYQSRSDNNKDGVQLLGVKTSEGEGNAAAR